MTDEYPTPTPRDLLVAAECLKRAAQRDSVDGALERVAALLEQLAPVLERFQPLIDAGMVPSFGQLMSQSDPDS